MHKRRSGNEMAFLRRAIEGLVEVQTPQDCFDALELTKNSGIIFGSLQKDSIVGFNSGGADAVSKLAADIYRLNENYQRGSEYLPFRKQVANFILERYFRHSSENIGNTDLSNLDKNISTWFSENAICRKHFIPCTIIPDHGSAFDIGPVNFVHLEDFVKDSIHKEQIDKIVCEKFIQAMNGRYANWVAIIEIDGAEEKRSSALADLAIDIAISGIKLVIPHYESRHMARITGRTWPTWIGHMYTTEEKTSGSFTNAQPGRTLLRESFDAYIYNQSSILDSVGNRIRSFINLSEPMSSLDQAWCNAAYWFHEATTEPLDSIAIAKFETAIEVLFKAENTKGSQSRIEAAFKAFFSPLSKETTAESEIKNFAKNIVESRSSVLHGTQPTLFNYKTKVGRSDVNYVAFEFLRSFTIFLDKYSRSIPMETSDVTKFLAWVKQQQDINKVF